MFESVKIILHFGPLISKFQGETSNKYCILCLIMKKASAIFGKKRILFEIKEMNKPFLKQE